MDSNTAQLSENNPPLPATSLFPGNGQEPVLPEENPRPVDIAERIQTVDLIRGFALLGILLMNIPGFGIDNSAFNTVLRGPHNSTDFRTMAVIFAFFDGTMRGLFSMLFGAGMILFTLNKKESPGNVTVAEYYYRRLLWLVLFGLFNAYILLWEGDILFYYGLCGMLLYPFRKSSPKWLILIGFFCIGIGMLKNMLWYNETRATRATYLEAVAAGKAKTKLTEKQEQAKSRWEEIEKNQQTDTSKVNKHLQKMHAGYGTIFNYFIPRNASTETWGTYHGIWDMLSMMFIGMGLFMVGFFSNRLSTGTYAMWLVAGYGLGIPIGYIYFSGIIGSFNDLGTYVDAYSVPHWVLYDLRRVLLCIGHASLLLLVYRSRLVPWLMKALANVGQMAFTNYLMQSIICTLFFFGYGLDHYNNFKFHQLYYVVGSVWIFQLILSPIWLKYFRFGPFEWLWRSLTYWKKQPMKRIRE
ncbi:MAG: DUF418 domain-containing protein [Ferruginibacter sp.]